MRVKSHSPLYQNQTGPFYHAWEAERESFRQDSIRRNLKEILEFALEHSAFYRQRLGDFKIDYEATHPLLALPVLTPDELRKNLPPLGNSLMTFLSSQGYSVFQSGGTTGMPKVSPFTHPELEEINRCNARGFYASGLLPSDRVANLWAVGGLYMTFIHMNRVLQDYGCVSFPFSNHTPPDFIYQVSQLFQINCFTGITSVVLKALREMRPNMQKQSKSLQIEKVYFGGEHIYEADRQELAQYFGAKIISAPGYGTVESWYIGYQCSLCPNGVFHAFDDMVYIEILDEETAQPCEAGQIGMLHVTVFPRRLVPIIRLRIGDKARWINQACACGRTTPLFELLGRGDDILRIGYDSVDYASVQSLLASVPGLSGQMQMEKRREEGWDRLVIRIETPASKGSYAELAKKFEAAFLNDRPSFRGFVEKKSILPLKVELLQEGTLPQNPRTGKLIRIVDGEKP